MSKASQDLVYQRSRRGLDEDRLKKKSIQDHFKTESWGSKTESKLSLKRFETMSTGQVIKNKSVLRRIHNLISSCS